MARTSSAGTGSGRKRRTLVRPITASARDAARNRAKGSSLVRAGTPSQPPAMGGSTLSLSPSFTGASMPPKALMLRPFRNTPAYTVPFAR